MYVIGINKLYNTGFIILYLIYIYIRIFYNIIILNTKKSTLQNHFNQYKYIYKYILCLRYSDNRRICTLIVLRCIR